MLVRYGQKAGSLKAYNDSPYTLYCRKDGKDQRWHRAPVLRLWEGKTYVFEVMGEIPKGCGGIVLTEKPEGGEGSIPLLGTSVGTPGNPIILLPGSDTPDYFHYHDSICKNTGYIIRVDKKKSSRKN
jgi:hypothetical protein